MNHFYIIANESKDCGLNKAFTIKKFLEEYGKRCIVRNQELWREDFHTDSKDIPDDTECIIVLGGDGTLLQAARDVAGRKIPLLGINMGTLGFLAEIDVDKTEQALLQLVEENYCVEKRMMLHGEVHHTNGNVEAGESLNDIVLSRSGAIHVILYEIYVNGQLLKKYMADGIILSTPTGSTGYNMSAGGPIVEPKANLIVLTPVCPHTLNTRSIILSADDEIEIVMSEGKDNGNQEAMVSFDGRTGIFLNTGDHIFIKKSEAETSIIKMSNQSFLDVLHRKMNDI